MPLKKKGSPPITEKAFEESGSISRVAKGNLLEQELSCGIFNRGYPVLVSCQLLRSLNLGQLDQVIVQGEILKVYEIKVHKYNLSQKQLYRIRAAASFLSLIFNRSVKLEFINSLPKGH